MAEHNQTYEWICQCGDWQSDHENGFGICKVCGHSSAPWDKCKRYRRWKLEERFVGGEHLFEQMVNRG